ncbi:MAG: hypothetical protein ACTSSH_14180 [Candidatus Heimdallarchaeota archaeon]
MTAQIPDFVIFKKQNYSLVGIRGEGFFDPKNYGLNVTAASTACYRGYTLTFNCINDEILLDEILFNARANDLVEINGIKPEKYTGQLKAFFSHIYKNLQFKIGFTGELIIAREFIDEMYVHMGYQKPKSFRVVFRLIIGNDIIKEVKDLFGRMQEKRAEKPSDESNVEKYVTEAFSREIDEE